MVDCVSGPPLAVFQGLSRRHAVHARSDAGRTSVTVAPAPKLFIALFILLERGMAGGGLGVGGGGGGGESISVTYVCFCVSGRSSFYFHIVCVWLCQCVCV